MKVAFVSARLDCNDGVASHIELLATELVRHGVELTMVTGLITGETVAADRYATLRRNLAPWHKVSDDRLRLSVPVVRGLARVLRGGGFDVVHSHGLGLLPAIRAALLSVAPPIVATYHPSAHGNAEGDFNLGLSPKKRLAYRAFLEVTRPDKVIALSMDTVTLLSGQCGLSPGRIAQVVAGIDTAHFRPPTSFERAACRAKLGLDPDMLVCVLPGRLNLNKGHDIAIAAMQRLGAAYPDRVFRCLFPGSGAQEVEIRGMVAASADPSVFLMPGFVPQMREMYWASDIVILPSRSEGFALVVAEAMACGCAAIRTPSGGCTDQIVEGVTGFVIGFNDPVALAERLATFLNADRLHAVQAAALAHAHSHFSGRRMGEETRELYEQLAGNVC